MAKQERIKSEAAEYPVPQSRDAAVEAIAEIGRRQRQRERIAAAMNDELSEIKQRYESEALPHGAAIAGLSAGVQTWCEANRDELTGHGKVKFAELASGKVSWRTRPPKVSISSMEKVLAALRDMKLDRFIRTRQEVNKEAILAEPEAARHVKGITIKQGEDFVIVPFETELEEVV